MSLSPLWTSSDAVAATKGRSATDWAANGVSIDSRSVKRGDLFVAIKGPNFDGHAFVAPALAAGAAAAVVSQRPEGALPTTPLLVVKDPLEALGDLAAAARARAAARIAAVTGSVGKTSTKEALKLVLSAQGLTHASEGSLNNHWGVPLSLSRLPQDAAYGVFELGMNHAGELTPLSKLVRPHVAIITTIEAVHLEFFASVDEIAEAKAEVFAGIADGGVAVLNQDNDYFSYLTRRALAQGVAHVVGFGTAKGAWARLVDYQPAADGARIEAEIGGRQIRFTVGAPGRHWALNSLAVLAAAAHLGADLDASAAALAGMTAPKGRGARHRVALQDGAFTLIDESYNASPAAMRAAFSVLAGLALASGGRRIAVLGDMLELGADADAIHAALAPDLVASGAALVCTAGRHMDALYESLPREMRAGHAAKAEDLLPLVRQIVRPGDVVMIKGSHGSRMGLIVDALLSGAAASKAAANGH
ncbi:MAG TPA: UDP-N-acetylmuramoylalanyl-D-glutamyl-2,6-diaminopimelate--D-alanyl-D-alanine ligase [Alphaproteobacteria bacterium]|jgi:UDP-N-acetylmuramoyl-tripeptide--D-alanyl-D-alanine ligase